MLTGLSASYQRKRILEHAPKLPKRGCFTDSASASGTREAPLEPLGTIWNYLERPKALERAKRKWNSRRRLERPPGSSPPSGRARRRCWSCVERALRETWSMCWRGRKPSSPESSRESRMLSPSPNKPSAHSKSYINLCFLTTHSFTFRIWELLKSS